jgi:TPR repeat protein
MQDGNSRALIVETARALFANNPGGFTLALVCRETGLSRARLRKHFPTKKALLACLDEALPQLPADPPAAGSNNAASGFSDRISDCEQALASLNTNTEGVARDHAIPPMAIELPPMVASPMPVKRKKKSAPRPAAFDVRATAQRILAKAEETRKAEYQTRNKSAFASLPRLAAAAGLLLAVLTVSVGLVSFGGFARATQTPQPVPTLEQQATAAPEVLIIDATGAAPDPMYQETPAALRDVVVRARRGETQAQVHLAQSFLKGDGFAADPIAAARWSDEAAAQGDATAQFILGSLYAEGIKPNARLAFDWFAAAASRGNARAMHNLAIAYLNGSGVLQDAKAAAAWFEKAASAGYRDSAFDLGVLYERGEGVAQNSQDALKWYDQAASFGDPEAMQRATYLRSQLWQMAKR